MVAIQNSKQSKILIGGTTRGLWHKRSVPPYEFMVTAPVPTDTETYTDGQIEVFDATGARVYFAQSRFKGRGNSTWIAPKKPFKVRSLDRLQRPLIMPMSRDWALMADYYDESYLRSTVVYEIGRLATGRWHPRSYHGRLTWNGSVQGIYRLSETVDVQEHRVGVREMSNSDIAGNVLTGPYVLEVDDLFNDPGFRTTEDTPVMYDVPDVLGVTAQENYIQDWIEAYEVALVTNSNEAEILANTDLDSWVDWYLLQEFAKNVDSYWHKSIKFYKDQDAPNGDGKLHMSTPWDLDRSMGNFAATSPTGWFIQNQPLSGDSLDRPNWLYHMWTKSPTFRNACRTRWVEAFAPAISNIGSFVDAEAGRIAPWVVADRSQWLGGGSPSTADTAGGLKSWMAARAAWITANL